MADEPSADQQENKTERVQLLMAPSEVAAIDDWGFANRVRTRASAIRLLTARGLTYDALEKHATSARAVIAFFLSQKGFLQELASAGALPAKELRQYLSDFSEFNESINKETGLLREVGIFNIALDLMKENKRLTLKEAQESATKLFDEAAAEEEAGDAKKENPAS